MDKRWIVFFLVFMAAYFILVMPAARREQQPPAGDATNLVDESAGVDGVTSPTLSAGQVVREDAPARVQITVEDAPIELVETDLARVEISHRGAVPVSWQLLPSRYLEPVRDYDVGTTRVIDLVPQVNDRSQRELPLQLEGRPLAQFNEVLFEVEREQIGEDQELLTFTSPVISGVQVIKRYFFSEDSYVTDFVVEVMNYDQRTVIGDDTGWGIGWQGGLMQPVAGGRYAGNVRAGGSIGGELEMKELDYEDAPVRYDHNVGWGVQEKKYFMAALIPSPEDTPDAMEIAVRRRNRTPEYDRKGVGAPMSLVLKYPQSTMDANSSRVLDYSLVVSPKDYSFLMTLEDLPRPAGSLAPSAMAFDRVYLGQGWLRPISLFLLRILTWFASHVHNWGLAIILLVLVVKIVLYPLSHWAIKNQAKTMAEQQRIRPHLDVINKKYKDDPARKSQEMMKLYREHNINPLGMLRGCFPILLQMPIFFALYLLLDQAVELRGKEFLWIDDLTQPDRLIQFGFSIPLLGWDAFNILPLLMAITQYFTSKLMTANIQDPMQRQMMILMPVFFLFILYNMPSGLMLYWTVQNIWQIGHTVLTKRYVALHDSGSGGSAPTAANAT